MDRLIRLLLALGVATVLASYIAACDGSFSGGADTFAGGNGGGKGGDDGADGSGGKDGKGSGLDGEDAGTGGGTDSGRGGSDGGTDSGRGGSDGGFDGEDSGVDGGEDAGNDGGDSDGGNDDEDGLGIDDGFAVKVLHDAELVRTHANVSHTITVELLDEDDKVRQQGTVTYKGGEDVGVVKTIPNVCRNNGVTILRITVSGDGFNYVSTNGNSTVNQFNPQGKKVHIGFDNGKCFIIGCPPNYEPGKDDDLELTCPKAKEIELR